MEKGIIHIVMEDISLEDTERLRQSIHTLLETGTLNIRNAQVTLHFNAESVLDAIEMKLKRWQRNKPPLNLQDIMKYAKIEITRSQAKPFIQPGELKQFIHEETRR